MRLYTSFVQKYLFYNKNHKTSCKQRHYTNNKVFDFPRLYILLAKEWTLNWLQYYKMSDFYSKNLKFPDEYGGLHTSFWNYS